MASSSPVLGYPRSFLGLLVTGFLLVVLPLAGSLLYSAWNTEYLTERGTDAIFRAAQAARSSRSLVNRIGSIERLAQQITLRRDPALLADLTRAHKSVASVADELSRLSLENERLAALKRTMQGERLLYEQLSGGVPAALEPRSLGAQASALAADAYQVLAISDLVAFREVERLRTSAESAQRRLILSGLLASALALAIALVLTRVIARPIAQLDRAIRHMGRGEFTRPVRVSGPADLRLLGERLDWLRLRLTELEAQRSRFLRHLSHDLKTPLTALREGAELLGEQIAGPLAPPQRQVVAILRDNSRKLQQMIEELLDYQRLLHSAATLDAEPIALARLLHASVHAHRLAAVAKGQRLLLEAPRVTIWADPAKLRSIVDNLVGNAIKFTPPGGSITVLARERPARVEIDVIDTGPGVPVEERESIFDAFFRGRAGAAGRSEGTGLGLAIARDFVKAHGGRIELVAEAPGGHFRVLLPKRAAPSLVEAA